MEQLYDLKELERKALMGTPLLEGERNALQEHLSVAMMARQSFDFGAMEASGGAGIEGAAIMEQNRRFAAKGPKRPERKPFSYYDPPGAHEYQGPFLGTRNGVALMLKRFRDKLEEVRTTGKLTT